MVVKMRVPRASGQNQLSVRLLKLAMLFPSLKERAQNGGEDAVHRLVAHFSEADEVEVAEQSVGHRVAATP